MRIDINFDTLPKTEVCIRGLDRRLRDLSRLWTDFIAPFVFDEADDVFETEGYGRWHPLNVVYAARKARTHPGKGILQREGTYKEAATNPQHPGSLAEYSSTELVLGVRGSYFRSKFGVNYPAVHEVGNDERNIPMRFVYAAIAANPRFNERVGQLADKYQREEIAILERGS